MRFLLLTASLTMAEADTRHRARSSRLMRHELSSLAHPNNATDAPPNLLQADAGDRQCSTSASSAR